MNPTAIPTEAAVVAVDRAVLQQLAVKLLQRKGMFAAEAEIVVNRMIEADLLGRDADGIRTLAGLLEMMDLGDVDPRARLITMTETPAIAVLDGGTGMGQVAVTRAMLLAVEKAKAIGTGTVVVRNSQPCGDAGVYVRLAAEAGLIGFCTSSFGGNWLRGMSDQPFAWGIPIGDGPPLIWSTPCTRLSTGELARCRELGLPLPNGTALDEAGQPTISAEQAAALMETVPGWALAQAHVCAVLAGGLAGGKLPSRKKRHQPFADDAEHFVLAIHPETFGASPHFPVEWSSPLKELRSTLDSGSSWTDPTTVPLHPTDADRLKQLAAKIKFDVTW